MMNASHARSAKNLWIGSVGTGSGYGLATAARRCLGGAVNIVGTDINPAHLVAASPLCDSLLRFPPVSSPEFVDHLVLGLKRHAIDYYVALLDDEVLVAAELAAEGRIGWVNSNAPSPFTASLCLDKWACHSWLIGQGFPSPHTVLSTEFTWDDVAVIAKPRSGFGSQGVRHVGNAITASQVLSEDASLKGEVILQEVCVAPEVTLDLFRPINGGATRVICRERIETKAGVCTKARIFRDDELEDLGSELADGLGFRGAACVQVMRSETQGRWVVTDVNPRPGSGTSMCAAVGIDLLGAMVLDGLGLEGVDNLTVPVEGPDRFVVRSYREVELVVN